jgi:integrase
MSYYNKVRAALREAYMNKMIKENPCSRVKGIRGEEIHRQFLTFEELKKLVAITCENELLKKAFLFSALRGLRWSDVRALTWKKISYSEASGWVIEYTQKKTKGSEVLPVAEQAIRILGERLELRLRPGHTLRNYDCACVYRRIALPYSNRLLRLAEFLWHGRDIKARSPAGRSHEERYPFPRWTHNHRDIVQVLLQIEGWQRDNCPFAA